jgi:hypothetical protein
MRRFWLTEARWRFWLTEARRRSDGVTRSPVVEPAPGTSDTATMIDAPEVEAAPVACPAFRFTEALGAAPAAVAAPDAVPAVSDDVAVRDAPETLAPPDIEPG